MSFDRALREFVVHGNFAANTTEEIPMNTSQRLAAFAPLFLALSAFGANAANAADSAGNAPKQTVSYTDLNLTRAAGAQTLYRRIKWAAESVCAPLNGRQLIRRMSQSNCVASAVESAVKQVNEPLLTDYYLVRNPKSNRSPVLAIKR